jgi:signal peptidase II
MVERSLTAGPFHWLGLAAVALSALAADQLTKQIVVTQLGLGESVHVAGPFWIRHVNNPGIAFGLFSSWASAVTFLTAGAVIWMLFYFAKSGARHPILPVALGLLIGGSMGNLVDRLRIGHVTDFLDLRFWPAFNLADTFIVVGVAALLLALVAAERQPRIRRTPSGRTAPKTLG